MKDLLVDIIELRPPIYGWFAIFLSTEITNDILSDAKREFPSIVEKIPILRNKKIEEYFKNFLRALFESNLKTLSVDYAALFLGGKEGLICPSESSYLENRIYGEKTLEVIKFYIQQGFVKEDSFSDPDDHISIEFAFMSLLGSRFFNIIKNEGQNSLKAYELAKVQLNFLSEHLLKWIPIWAKEVEHFSETEFYRNLAAMAEAFVECDRAILENFSSSQPLSM
jgi:TorA maturation chaperone TorD